MEIILRSKDICEFFKISRAGLADWASVGCPKRGTGSWDLAAVFQWREEHIVGKLETKNEMAREKLRAQKAKADLQEMSAEQQRGDLISRQEVADQFVLRATIIKQDLLALPKRLAQWPDAAAVAKKHALHMLATYSRPLPSAWKVRRCAK